MLVTQSCPTLYNFLDCSPPGSSVHGILQARILERVATLFCRGSYQPTDWTRVSCIAGRFFTIWASRWLFVICSVQSCPTLHGPVDCSTLGFPVHHRILELAQTHVHWVVMPSNHLILCRSLLSLPSIFPSIRVFSSESVLCIRWPKYWSFSFSISPLNEYSGLISLKIDWLDLLAVQGTLKSLLQHHSSKASILQCSAFFIAQISHPYMTTVKTIALTRWTFVSKVMSLLFNMLGCFLL